jgi:hypothetical protein
MQCLVHATTSINAKAQWNQASHQTHAAWWRLEGRVRSMLTAIKMRNSSAQSTLYYQDNNSRNALVIHAALLYHAASTLLRTRTRLHARLALFERCPMSLSLAQNGHVPIV